MQKYFLIALGGALGSIARYWVGTVIANRFGTKFHYGTFVINVTACVIIGFALSFLGRRVDLSPSWRFLIPVGFVGAYSTFSTFEWEIFSDLQGSSFLIGGLYLVLSIILGLIGVWCGAIAARAMS